MFGLYNVPLATYLKPNDAKVELFVLYSHTKLGLPVPWVLEVNAPVSKGVSSRM